MIETKLHPDKITDFLIQKVKNPNTMFIFSTDTVMNSWIEYLITNPEKSGLEALPLERFMAWDNFKRKYLKEEKENTTAVPSILRKLYVQDFISRNARLPEAERLQIVINPHEEAAKGATSFADWISKNLPSLHYWKKRLEENKEAYGELDLEDKDYLKIYEDYKLFLERNNLFEPAWLNSLSFSNCNTDFIIFYPELLEDFGDFAEVLKDKDNVSIVTLPENLPNPKVYLYPDSRSELRQTMLQIISLVKGRKADWSEIALSVPNIDVYRPYLEREFSLYEIPYVIKAGVALTKNSAGKIFQEIYNCHNENFSFDSIRALILDECVPWKAEHTSKREALIRVGNEMRCICSPSEKDIWLSAFQSKINRLKNDKIQEAYYIELKDFYSKIKFHVEEFFKEQTFAGINKAWQSFKVFFLEENNQFTESANNILGRCVTELKEIIQIEEDYADCNLQISDPFNFFLNELNGKKYTPQQKNKYGVNIFAYKLSGPACFKYQFVIDASQKNLEIPYKRLTFLNATKRGKLHLIEEDKKIQASEVFIQLYAKQCTESKKAPADYSDFVTFSAAESTFSGFAIPHSSLAVQTTTSSDGRKSNLLPNLDEQDYILAEHNFMLNPAANPVPASLTASQKEQFKNWCQTCSTENNETGTINSKLRDNLTHLLIKNRNAKDINGKEVSDNRLKITARSDLEKFFPCPRKWLFSSVLELHEDTLDTNLMQSFDMGNLNHKILELFISEQEGQTLPFYDEESDSFKIIKKTEDQINPPAEDFQLDLLPFVEKAIFSLSFRDSPLVTSSLLDQKESLANTIQDFLKYLLPPFGLKSGKNPGQDRIAGIGNCTVVGCEKKLCNPSENYDFYGKIDCLLLSPSNDWIIIDYKNSTIPGKSDYSVNKNDLLKDYQMAVYCKLIKEEEKHQIAAGLFYSITKNELQRPIDIFSKESVKDENGDSIKESVIDENGKKSQKTVYKPSGKFEDYQESVSIMKQYADTFSAIVNPESGKLDFNPRSSSSEKDRLNVKIHEDCISCPFKGICRTTYNVGKKELSKEYETKGAN